MFLQFNLHISLIPLFHDERNESNERSFVMRNGSGLYDNEAQFKIAENILKKGTIMSLKSGLTLPDDKTIENMYGSSSKIVGMETCAKYRKKITYKNRIIAPAGLFNSGTHYLFELLSKNCILDNVQQVQESVAWGKHIPASWRDNWTKNVPNQKGKGEWKGKHPNKDRYPYVDKGRVLPIVITKDPYTWMQSMCHHPYSLFWLHDPDHCPNLVPNEIDLKHNWTDTPSAIVMHRRASNFTYHSSLVGLWNDWYSDYYDEFRHPRLIIRYEDLLFRPHSVLKDVCDCAGGEMKEFKPIYHDVKGNQGSHQGSTSNVLDAFILYGNAEKRIKGYTNEDLKYAEDHLSQDLMEVFGYNHPQKEVKI